MAYWDDMTAQACIDAAMKRIGAKVKSVLDEATKQS